MTLTIEDGAALVRRVHDAVATVDGVRSESEGDDPDRYVVILPA